MTKLADLPISEIVNVLSQIEKDISVPRNVRDKVRTVCDALCNDTKSLAVRIDKSLQELDDIGNDPNVPIYTKTQVWNVVSQLESTKI